MDVVNATAEVPQHTSRINWRSRFAEDFSVRNDNGVSAENKSFANAPAIFFCGRNGLSQCQSANVVTGRFITQARFIHTRAANLELDSSVSQDFCAARRRRC